MSKNWMQADINVGCPLRIEFLAIVQVWLNLSLILQSPRHSLFTNNEWGGGNL